MGDFKVDFGQSLFMCILYVSIGSISIFCSLTTLTLYLTSGDLRKKYLLYWVLDMCELLDAVSYVLLGTGRGHLLLTDLLGTSTTVRDCFFHRYWPHSLILGTQLPSICTLFLSFERILAVVRPAVYKRACTQSFKYALTAMVPIWAVLTLTAAGLSVIGDEGDRVVGTKHCAIITSTSKWYATFHFIFIVLAYVVSFVSTLVVWATRRVWRNLTKSKYGSQDDKLGMILAMSGTSIVLLASPAVVMLTIRWDITEWGDIEVAVTYAMPGFLSVVNTIIAFRFRKELRAQLMHILGIKMETFTILTPLFVIALLVFLTLRLAIKYCKPSRSSIGASSPSTDTEAPDFTRVANHLFVSNTPHTYSRIYVDESSNVRSVTITRIASPGHQHIVGLVLDPNALMSLRHHHHHRQHLHHQPPTYEDSIKSHSPPKYDTTPATTNSTTRNSMELPTSSATTARVDGTQVPRGSTPFSPRSMSDSWLAAPIGGGGGGEEEERKSAR